MTHEIQTVQIDPTTDLSLIGTSTESELRARMQHMQTMIALKKEFLQNNLKEGIDKDFAVIPGTQKKGLLKPGAEKLLDWHSYYATFELKSEVQDWDRDLFAYTYRCTIKQRGSNVILGDCEGDCSSMESKYRFEWKWPNELPKGVDVESLVSKNFGNDEHPRIKYQVVTRAADKRNTIRKMAQKRALIGATVIATATSDLFSSDEIDEEGTTTGTASADGTAAGTTAHKGDYGDPISEAQGKRLYAIRSSKKIDKNEFAKWLKAKYGIDDDRKIGRKIYDDICNACQSGHLEMPKAETKPEPTPQSSPAPAGAKLTAHYIESLTMAINDSGKTEKQFLEFLGNFSSGYVGKGINDILIVDFDAIMGAFDKALKAGAV